MSWDIYSIEAEPAGQLVGSFFENKLDITRVKDSYRCKENKKVLRRIISKKVKSKNRVLALCGSGNLHHYTYGLSMLANSRSKDYGYIHIDNHNDYSSGAYNKDTLSCGSFVEQILDDANASYALFLGPPGDIRLIDYPQMVEPWSKVSDMLEKNLELLPREVYLTIDLDVMDENEMTADWDQGTMKRDELFNIVSTIRSNKYIIGADVHGLSTNLADQYQSEYYTDYDVYEDTNKSLGLYEMIVSILTAKNP